MVQPSLDAFLYAFKAAPRAYLLSQGPDVLTSQSLHKIWAWNECYDLCHSGCGTVASLSGFDTAAINEPVEPIQSARLTIDQLPWDGTPVAYPLSAVDGTFDTVQEAISTTLEMSCFPAVAIRSTCRRKIVGKIGASSLPNS